MIILKLVVFVIRPIDSANYISAHSRGWGVCVQSDEKNINCVWNFLEGRIFLWGSMPLCPPPFGYGADGYRG